MRDQPFEDFEATCTVGEGDTLIDHESHREGKRPRAKMLTRAHILRTPLGRWNGPRKLLYPCAVPGISLTDYSRNAQAKGWGAPCTGARTTITLTNGVRLTVRSEIAELTRLIMNANIRQGYSYRQADTGAYNCRYISGTTVWSNHAWGLAIDENWQSNPFTYPLKTDRPAWEQQRWQRYGFALGINYTGKKDAMHNEFMGTPAQAAQALALAQREIGGGAPVPPPPPPPSRSRRSPTARRPRQCGISSSSWSRTSPPTTSTRQRLSTATSRRLGWPSSSGGSASRGLTRTAPSLGHARTLRSTSTAIGADSAQLGGIRCSST
jgi:hypothetical protein